MSSFLLTTASRQERSDPGRIAPFLDHNVTHHGQLTLTPPQNAGRIRKGGKSAKNLERARTERRRDVDEPRFNIAAPASPRAASRRGNTVSERNPRPPPAGSSRISRDSMIPDYPPPTFQEAMMTPPFIPPAVLEQAEASQSPDPSDELPPPADYADDREALPVPSFPSETSTQEIVDSTPMTPEPLTLHTEITPAVSHESPESHSHVSAESPDTSLEDPNIELLDLDPAGWDEERLLREQLRRRANRIHRRQHGQEVALTVDLNETPHDLQQPGEQLHDRYVRHDCPKLLQCGASDLRNDQVFDQLGGPPPGSPKGSKWKRLFIPTIGHNSDGIPPSPTVSTPRSPRFGNLSSALASSLTLATPSTPSPSKPFTNPIAPPHKKDHSVVRRIFNPKGKDREWYDSLTDRNPRDSMEGWDVVPQSLIEESKRVKIDRTGRPRSPSGSSEVLSQLKQPVSEHESPAPSAVCLQPSQGGQEHPAFLDRPVRHSPQALSPFPMFSANSSVVSLPISATAHEQLQPVHNRSPGIEAANGRLGSPYLTRRQTLSTAHASPSVVWLPLIANTDGDITVAGAPVLSPMPSHNIYGSPRMSPHLSSDFTRIERQHSRSPSSPPSLSHASTRLAHLVTSPLARSITPEPDVAPSPTLIESPVEDSPRETENARDGPTLRSPASASTLTSTSDPPSTPSTPTHHYRGRPLPQLPGPSFPFDPATHTPLARSALLPDQLQSGQFGSMTDLELLAAQAVDDDREGRRYEDLLRVAELVGSAAPQMDCVKMPPSDRVKLVRRRVTKDGRTKLKLTLMNTVVDKCGICLSQFKDAEVACLGTGCQHAFHEYCLQRWLAKSRSCPLCRASV